MGGATEPWSSEYNVPSTEDLSGSVSSQLTQNSPFGHLGDTVTRTSLMSRDLDESPGIRRDDTGDGSGDGEDAQTLITSSEALPGERAVDADHLPPAASTTEAAAADEAESSAAMADDVSAANDTHVAGAGRNIDPAAERDEVEGGEVVFRQENVAVHPAVAASKRIRGTLRLVKQGPTVYLSWTPYSFSEQPSEPGPSHLPQPPSMRQQHKERQYAIRAVALAEIRSIRRHTPTIGWQYVIIVLNTGLAFPPLYFYEGGVRAFISAVKQHATLMKSFDDPNVYLVNDTQDPLQRSLSSLRIPGAGSGFTTPRSGSHSGGGSRRSHLGEPSSAPVQGPQDIPFKVMEGFAGLTRLARNAMNLGARGAGNRILGGDDAAERMPVRIVPQSTPSTAPSAGTQTAPSTASSGVGQFELVDPLEEVLSKSRAKAEAQGPPLTHEEWVSYFDAEGRIPNKAAVCERIFQTGIESELRREVWKFLLAYYPFDSTYAERREIEESKRKEYLVYKTQWQSVTEVQARRFAKYRERISRIDKDVVRTDRVLPVFKDDDSPLFDVLRSILLTYSFYNFDLGYCQGMSDLLSPFLLIMEDEADAFWCFAAFMESMGKNFNRDQTGMHSQLLAVSKLTRLCDPPLFQYLESIDAGNFFCCFRWLLILFKREFEFEDVLRLWEQIWTCPSTKNFHIYVCVAILKRFRRTIIDDQMEFDTLLRFVNELSGRIDLDEVLGLAESLCSWAGEQGEACMPLAQEEELGLIEGPETANAD